MKLLRDLTWWQPALLMLGAVVLLVVLSGVVPCR